VRNQVRSSQYNAQVSAADLANERLTEQASLAEYFFEIRGQDALQKILDEAVDADKKSLDAEQGRYDTGVDDRDLAGAGADARWPRAIGGHQQQCGARAV
jgi:outer membrane protein TolC